MTPMHNPAHPGEVLREYLPAGLAINEVAKRLGVTRQALSALLNARAGISAEMALRLEGALGTSAEMWIQMQANHDLWMARQRPKPKVSRLIGKQHGAGRVVGLARLRGSATTKVKADRLMALTRGD